MLIQFHEYLTIHNIYLYTNFGILPFWFMLIIAPNSRITQIFINSIVLPLILSSAYIYILYKSILLGDDLLNLFKIYLSLDDLYTLFSTESFLLIFWLHFLALNIFLGSWVSKDSLKFNVSRYITIISLILCYFCGPVGLVFYWLFRIFFAKKISLHD